VRSQAWSIAVHPDRRQRHALVIVAGPLEIRAGEASGLGASSFAAALSIQELHPRTDDDLSDMIRCIVGAGPTARDIEL